jgi:hypothetical protein
MINAANSALTSFDMATSSELLQFGMTTGTYEPAGRQLPVRRALAPWPSGHDISLGRAVGEYGLASSRSH